MDDTDFFKNATLRICGNLEIEDALHSLLVYLGGFIPVSRVFLHYYDEELKSMRVIAWAEGDSGKKLDYVVPLSSGVMEIGKYSPDDRDVLLIDEPEVFPFSRHMMKTLNMTMSSVIFMFLRTKERYLGNFVLHSFGEPKFSEEDLDLIDSLKEPLMVAMSNALKHREVVRLRDRLRDDNRQLHQDLQRMMGDEIIGADFGLRDTMQQVHKVASTETPVLLLGETGVGKDVIANAIHRSSPRHDGPFIPVNCGAIPDSLIDSELFGHEKGAFTGAMANKRGRFERADKGTILLDEIGEMPLEAQVRLLRVLQQREIERVGGTTSIPVDIRIIAATNKDLKEMVTDGRFREDLYYRLNVFPIVVPPLRERKVDIAALVQHFIERKARDLKLGPTPALVPGAIDALMAYSWPGNVRELENVVERAMILHRGDPLRFDGLEPTPAAGSQSALHTPTKDTLELDFVVAEHIRRVLDQTDGKIHGSGGAAELLDMNPSTLRHRMRKLGIVAKKP